MFKKSKYFWGFVLTIGLLLPLKSNAETIVGTCYEPDGKRLDYENGEFRESDDRYSNSNPTFSLNTERPNVLVEKWPSTAPDGSLTREEVDELVPPTATEAAVVFRSHQIIHAVSTSESESYSTTLYLDRGIGIFTRVRFKPGDQEDLLEKALVPMGAVYKAKCTFNRFP